MPRLRKRSAAQRRQDIRQNNINYRQRNEENDRIRNSQILASQRENEDYRANERNRDRIAHSISRRGSRNRAAEQERNTLQHSIHRQDSAYRAVEQVRNTIQHIAHREDEHFRQREREQDALNHSARRSNPVYREIEQQRNTIQRIAHREDENFRQTERERDAQNHSARRSDPVYREIEQERNTIEHIAHREDENFRQTERERDAQNHSARRSDPVYRQIEQERNTIEHIAHREDENFRQTERERDAQNHSARRSDPVYRQIEQERNTIEHIAHREDENFRQTERERDAQNHSARRSDPVYRQIEQERNTIEHIAHREDENFRQTERERDAQNHSARRSDPAFRVNEQERNTIEHIAHREDGSFRQGERDRDAVARSITRSNSINRAIEQNLNSISRQETRRELRDRTQNENQIRYDRVRNHRMNTANQVNENQRQAERNRAIRQDRSPDTQNQLLTAGAHRHNTRMLAEFNANAKKGPTEVCTCCGGLWFPNQVKELDRDDFPLVTPVFCLSEIFPSENDFYKFCNTCYKVVKNGRVPNLCLNNGFHFPTIPPELSSLTALEERFVAPRIPFMRIVSLGYNRQCAVRGAVVNVPIDVVETVKVLPRMSNNTEVIQVHLKRKLEYNHSFMTEVIRPGKVFEAARYLVDTELYTKHSILISDRWLDSVGLDEEIQFISNNDDQQVVQGLVNENSDPDPVEEFNPQETLLENNPIENVPIGGINIAPAEGRRPLDIIADSDSEELSYPSIYCGIKRKCKTTVAKLVKSEVRRYDRRCARVDKVLYSYKKVELSKIKSSISTCLRKKRGPSNHTASNMLDETYVQDLVQHDEGYHILKGVRSSPAHWEAEKRKVLAMIRQFGLPTFFITLSAAESQWPELLVILVKILEDREITEEEAMRYTTLEKYNLIRMDPITCSRYFDQRIRHLFKHFKANGGIFDEHKVIKFYWRIEFQQRGSPHVHGIYWLENAPTLNIGDSNSIEAVVSFIDKYITTDSTIAEVENYISYQQHHHSKSCQREIRGQKVCRFRIPHAPLPHTEILQPLPEDIDKNDLERHQENYDKIHNLLNANLSDQDIIQLESFEQFLQDERINLTLSDYILALRSSLKKPQVFLKRTFKDKSINAFNPNILAMQRANMDIQFVLDPYACVAYIVNYINKSNRGVSRLLQEAMNEIKAGNFTVKQRLQHIGNKFISASEVSGQEASYNILGMHLSQCSNAEVYVNILVPEKRVRIIKPRQELENMSAESTDVFQKNLLDHYIQRPDSMENICLAYFAAYYKFTKSLRRSARRQEEEEDDIEEEDTVNDQVGRPIPLKDNSGYIYKKRNPSIIRFASFKVDVTRGDYFRGLVMLYKPWRNEVTELLESDNEETCNANMDIIELNRREFEIYKEGELEEILQRVQEDNNERNESPQDNIAASQILDSEFRGLAVPEIEENINILNINGAEDHIDDGSSAEVRLIRLPPLISKFDMLASVRSLNVKQREYLHHLLHNVVENVKFFEYVGGGAGVGKSRLIKTIYQSVTTRFNSVPGSNPDLPKVLLSAPTGKAAFGIGGATLHSLFSLPVNQSAGEIRPLSNDTVNSILSKFIDVKLLIIDEISMVGARMFGHLDSRLKQIFKNTEAFGGLSILVFGDLKQLSPVGDKWIFNPNSSNPYGAIAGEVLWHNFSFYELTEIMRQREDQRFAQALNAMALGEMEEDQVSLIQSRVVKSRHLLPTDAINLFVSNKDVDRYNNLRLQQIPTEQFVAKAFDIVKSASLPQDQNARILSLVKNMTPSETQGLCYELKLKSTAKYMMTVNIDTNDGLVNGATGVLMSVDFYRGTTNPAILWILFSEECVGIEARRKKPHTTETLWTPVEKCVRVFQYKSNRQVTIERRQFPLVVAEGITIHKSQGATYSKVVVNSFKSMQRASLYVACSRATNASGLFIFDEFIPPKTLEITNPVKIELERLRFTKALCLQNNFMRSDEFTVKLYYQNIQSIQAHYEDIATDPTLLNSDIICLVETWAFQEEDYILHDFRCLPKLDCCNTTTEHRNRNKRGIMIYIRTSKLSDTEYLFGIEHIHKLQGNTYVLQILVFRFKDVFFIVLYRPPSFPENLLLDTLVEVMNLLHNFTGAEVQKVFVIGDINICRKSLHRCNIEDFLIERQFVSLLEKTVSTTKHGTHIDWAFTNCDFYDGIACIYKTIHSHHDGILIAIK